MHLGKLLTAFSLWKRPPEQQIGSGESLAYCLHNGPIKNAGEATHIGSASPSSLSLSAAHDAAAGKPLPEDVMHLVVLDIDHRVHVFESTNGRAHLLIQHRMSREKYEKLVDVMVEVGLLNPGIKRQLVERGQTQVFTPWTIKQSHHGSSDKDDGGDLI